MITKCDCQQCGQPIEFEAAQIQKASETPYRIMGQEIDCPHCTIPTQLYIIKNSASRAPRAAAEAFTPKKSITETNLGWQSISIAAGLMLVIFACIYFSAVAGKTGVSDFFGTAFGIALGVGFAVILICLLVLITLQKLWIPILSIILFVIGLCQFADGVLTWNSTVSSENGTIYQQQFAEMEIIGGAVIIGLSLIAHVGSRILKAVAAKVS
jgi:hypothetical protein